ncbi:hypothetical protein BTE48_12065 [Oceanospirillum multiglobuliferum]|uniref:Uncharacterized protein n=2 Tax=Oceanospirillum multiglobuliferum TaxID=64969 RepID=A0A1V4T2K4_9GAMM|nr:hypothetical protein BTE48_12065 [Oceanospirillum multiglobuliferum]
MIFYTKLLKLLLTLVLTCLGYFLIANHASAYIVVPAKTAQDNYTLVLQIQQDVLLLQQFANRSVKLPDVDVIAPKEPRHVYQKALEVLAKVNRYREIKQLGAITTPLYPTREITPDEVHTLIQHLQGEVRLLLPTHLQANKPIEKLQLSVSPTNVYQQLWRISLAFDPLLGVRGFTPSDVYQQAEYLVDLIKFLRLSQNLPNDVAPPKLGKGKHPNHALKSAYQLQGQIYQVQKNLWMKAPELAPTVPKRVITPTDVYDALQVNIAELQRVKYRLGIEFEQRMPELKRNKTPDDVIQMLSWAEKMLPTFQVDGPIFQYRRDTLQKNLSDIYQVVNRLRNQLSALQKARGVRLKLSLVLPTTEVNLRHVLQLNLQSLRRMNLLRKSIKQLPTNVPHPPLHKVTPTELYEMALRLESELANYFDHIGFTPVTNTQLSTVTEPSEKQLYAELHQVSQYLDALISKKDFSLHMLYQEAHDIRTELHAIYQQIGRNPTAFVADDYVINNGQDNSTLLSKSLDLLQAVQKIHSRAGAFLLPPPNKQNISTAALSDIETNLSLIHDELIAVKPFFGLFSMSSFTAVSQKGVSREKLAQELAYIERLINDLLKPEAE